MRRPAAEGSRFASSPGCKRIEAGSLLPIEVRQRKDRSLLRFEAANGSRRGVRFSSKVRRAEGSGFASILKLAKRVRQDREVRLSIAACPCGKAVLGLPRIGGLRRHSFPGSFCLSERAPGGEERTFASASNRPRGKTKGPGLSADPGDGETGRFGAPRANLFEAARGESCCDASERGTGIQASALPGLAGNRPGLTAWTGPTGIARRLRPPRGVRPPSG